MDEGITEQTETTEQSMITPDKAIKTIYTKLKNSENENDFRSNALTPIDNEIKNLLSRSSFSTSN